MDQKRLAKIPQNKNNKITTLQGGKILTLVGGTWDISNVGTVFKRCGFVKQTQRTITRMEKCYLKTFIPPTI